MCRVGGMRSVLKNRIAGNRLEVLGVDEEYAWLVGKPWVHADGIPNMTCMCLLSLASRSFVVLKTVLYTVR